MPVALKVAGIAPIVQVTIPPVTTSKPMSYPLRRSTGSLAWNPLRLHPAQGRRARVSVGEEV